jgi:hypothetical protein
MPKKYSITKFLIQCQIRFAYECCLDFELAVLFDSFCVRWSWPPFTNSSLRSHFLSRLSVRIAKPGFRTSCIYFCWCSFCCRVRWLCCLLPAPLFEWHINSSSSWKRRYINIYQFHAINFNINNISLENWFPIMIEIKHFKFIIDDNRLTWELKIFNVKFYACCRSME